MGSEGRRILAVIDSSHAEVFLRPTSKIVSDWQEVCEALESNLVRQDLERCFLQSPRVTIG